MSSLGPVVIGVDVGTYETKGVLVDRAGAIVAQHRRAHRVSMPEPGFVEHDPIAVWWDGFVETARALLADAPVQASDVQAIAVSGIGPCVLPIDGSGVPLRDAILYGVDARASTQINELTARMGAENIRRKSGTDLSSQSAGPKILWIEQNEPEIFARAALFVTCQTFIVGRLTGQWVIDHATGAYFHPFYDRGRGEWDTADVPSALRTEQLPGLAWSSEIAGTITAEAAQATGLRTGTPVLAGAPDAPAEAFSAGVADAGDMMLMYGSSHFIIEVVDEQHTSRKLWPAPFLLPGTHLVAAGTSTAGSFTRWYADLVAADDASTDDVYTALTRLAAASPPGANGLIALPYLSGERTPLYDPDARGAFLGLRLDHGRGDLARAVVEAIAQSAAAAVRQYDTEDLEPTRIRAVGGGTKNAVWTQVVSDILGRRQEVVRGPGACYGDAMLAGLAAGFLPGRAAARDWVSPGETVEPRPGLRTLYERQRRVFEQLYQTTRPVLAALRELHDTTNEEDHA